MKKKAFTLAEVLITLGIIGVVAALTIPSLIAKHKEKETVSKLKNIFSTLSNAYTLILNEHDSPEKW
ncbi:MAG: prepilin-type N-terminal cleavage/methylation domain-containing protein [Heliobacteriaceae bacterium]|jgi:prepilin-type N-terminal cleavage/methylation domain-containing protein|nr:prepilin-type N-terminal cleavage/methylation domain-containing protein [Heliobacteriaceae bacterium]